MEGRACAAQAAEVCVREPFIHLGQEPAPRGGVRVWADRGENQDHTGVVQEIVGARRVSMSLQEGYRSLPREVALLAGVGSRLEVWVRALRGGAVAAETGRGTRMSCAAQESHPKCSWKWVTGDGEQCWGPHLASCRAYCVGLRSCGCPLCPLVRLGGTSGSRGLSRSDKEPLLASKSAASCAVAVLVCPHSGPRRSACMAGTSPLPGALLSRSPRNGVAKDPFKSRRVDVVVESESGRWEKRLRILQRFLSGAEGPRQACLKTGRSPSS